MHAVIPFQIDHVFVCVSAGAPEADRVLDIGLSEGPPNRHSGQGTANRRIFFDTTMLEFLWVEDEAAAHGRLGLWERWRRRDSDACPFGVCFRPTDDTRLPPPFPTWTYQPAYSPIAIEVGLNSEVIEEPFLFYIPFIRAASTEPVRHRLGIKDLTAVQITSPALPHISPVLQSALDSGLITLQPANGYQMHLAFDHSQRSAMQDFRPELPLMMAW